MFLIPASLTTLWVWISPFRWAKAWGMILISHFIQDIMSLHVHSKGFLVPCSSKESQNIPGNHFLPYGRNGQSQTSGWIFVFDAALFQPHPLLSKLEFEKLLEGTLAFPSFSRYPFLPQPSWLASWQWVLVQRIQRSLKITIFWMLSQYETYLKGQKSKRIHVYVMQCIRKGHETFYKTIL